MPLLDKVLDLAGVLSAEGWESYIVFALALIFSYLLSCVCYRYGKRDIPNERSSHTIPTSRLGGVAVAFSMSCFSFLTLSNNIMFNYEYFCVPIAFALLGLADDFFSLSSRVRLILQTALGIMGAYFIVSVVFDGGFMDYELPQFAAAVCLIALCLISFVNIFNFMDGLNGISVLNSLVFALGLFFIFDMSFFMLPVIIGCLLGFFVFNFQGKLFLGDSGSYFLGAFFASAPFVALKSSSYNSSVFCNSIHLSDLLITALFMALLYSPYIIDCAVTLLKRLMSGKNVFGAHKEHFYQRLNQSGVSHMGVSLIYASFSFLSLLICYVLVQKLSGAAIA
jgi:UDP-N-acetylmuramyl pentapeptide phosphotransferase/UDP-N-acetylglucosamine-1-phosphate transferase